MGHRFSKNLLLGTEGAKIAVKQQKGPLGGPKSENLLYLSNYDSIRPKNWQMLRTNWYNCFRKDFMGYRVCKNQLLGTKGAKIAVEQQKGAYFDPKSEYLLYFSNYDSVRLKNWHMFRTNYYNCFKKGFMGYRVCKNWLLGT